MAAVITFFGKIRRGRKENMMEKKIFPKNGEIYEAFAEFDINYRTIHLSSYTGGGRALFPSGERLIIDTCGRNRINVYCDAVNYDILEERIVPKISRNSLTYQGYYFHFAITTLHKHCRKIESR